MKFRKIYEKGIGLLELMLSLAVIAMLLLMATRYFAQARENLKVTEAVKDINTLVQASFRWAEGNPSFKGIDIPTLTKAGELSKVWDSKQNPWGGSYILSDKSNEQIQINLGDVPISACNNINDIMTQHNISRSVCDNSRVYSAYYPYK